MEAMELLLPAPGAGRSTPATSRMEANKAGSVSGASESTVMSRPSSTVVFSFPGDKPGDKLGIHSRNNPADECAMDNENQDNDVDSEDAEEEVEEGPPDFRYRHISDVMSALGGLWRRHLYTDLTIVVEGKAIRCHKVILACASPYFHSRLFTGRRESPIDKIFITNIPKTIVEEVLDFIYTGECPISLDNAEELLKTASLFQLTALQDMADLYLSENIDGNNCLRLYKLANKTTSPLVKEQARWVINKNFVSLWSTPIFKQLTCKELIDIIGQEDLVVPNEDNVCNAILTWLEADKDKRRLMLSEILRHVNLPKQRKEYIRQTLDSDKIVKADVVCQRLMKRVKKANQISLEQRISQGMEFKH